MEYIIQVVLVLMFNVVIMVSAREVNCADILDNQVLLLWLYNVFVSSVATNHS